jgi:EEF1A N-terminal glycine/lysine methyltransferase
MLADLIRVIPDCQDDQDPEDIFSSSLSTLFPDDIQVQHGDSRSKVVYKSVCGELEFRCADVNGEEDRTKFAHYLWNSGILMGELIGGRPVQPRRDADCNGSWWLSEREESLWAMKGERVLELGAGRYNFS